MAGLMELIEQCIASSEGRTPSDEFMLYRHDATMWTAEIGNPTSSVMLGESAGHFRGEGGTAEEAVSNLLALINSGA